MAEKEWGVPTFATVVDKEWGRRVLFLPLVDKEMCREGRGCTYFCHCGRQGMGT